MNVRVHYFLPISESKGQYTVYPYTVSCLSAMLEAGMNIRVHHCFTPMTLEASRAQEVLKPFS